jgi:uncharacterized protein
MPTIAHHNPGSFCWFELGTTDQAAAKEFYTSLFGWTVNDFPIGPADYYSMFQLQGSDVGAAYTLRPDQVSQGVPPHWMLYIAVENADRTAAQAGENGGKIFAPPFDVFSFGRMAVIADPTGAVFSIWQAKEHKGTGIAGVDGTACWADLNTPDVATAQRFYTTLFHWDFQTSPKDPSGYLHIKNGEESIGGVPPASIYNPQIPPHWMIYFLTSDCDATAGRAKELGGHLAVPSTNIPNTGRYAVLKDPQGAVFAIFQPERK